MTWMKGVSGLASKVWHMHPVIFMSTILDTEKTIIFPLKVKPENDVNGVWKRYCWAASLTDSNASQAIFGRNRSGGERKHAARDLYTRPDTEIVAICHGVVRSISNYYYGTWQITVEHKASDGRHFYIRYGEVDRESITVSINEEIEQGRVIAKAGLMIKPNGRHPEIIRGSTVYMLHFEYYLGEASTPPPNNTTDLPYKRRRDLRDPLEILLEGYRNVFNNNKNNFGNRLPIENLEVSEAGKTFIKNWEHFESIAYNDSEGYCTIGYGHLIEKNRCENIILPEEFREGITPERANELFNLRLPDYVSELKRNVTVDLYQHEFDALISLLFNMGVMRKAPQLKSKLNNQDYGGASIEFLDITNGGTAGLVLRRQKEQNMFLNADYDSTH